MLAVGRLSAEKGFDLLLDASHPYAAQISANAAQAARHVIRTSHCVTVATQDELVSLVTGGVSVESCGSDAEEL